MYEVFYKLKAEPFRLSPDHHFCYNHKCYAKARAYMAYAFMRAEGFVMITGRPCEGSRQTFSRCQSCSFGRSVAGARSAGGRKFYE